MMRFIAMPRFYFHLYNDLVSLDQEGMDLRDVEAARETALESARAMVCDSVHHGHLNLDHRIEVTDERHQPVLTLIFREAFTIEG